MSGISIEHNLNELINKIDNVPNNIKEMISRCLYDSYDSLKSDLRTRFGDAIDYAEFNIEYSGNSFSIVISNLNEFVLGYQTDSDANEISEYATNIVLKNIIDTINKEGIFGAIL